MKMPFKTEAEAKKAMEEYGKGLAKLNPCQLLLWAVFLCITTPFLALYVLPVEICLAEWSGNSKA